MKTQSVLIAGAAAFGEEIRAEVERAGYAVAGVVGSGAEAVALAAQAPPDLVLMSVPLPGELEAMEAARQIRAAHDIPVVFLAAHAPADGLKLADPGLFHDYSLQFVLPNDLRDALAAIFHRRAQTRELRDSDERWRSLFDLSPEIIVVTALADGRYVAVNEAFVQFTGYSREEALGRTSAELDIWVNRHDRDLVMQLLRERGSVRNFPTEFRKASGETFPAFVSLSPINLAGQPCLISSVVDITERQRAERTMQQQRELLQAKNEALEAQNSDLAASEARFRQLAENIREAFFLSSARPYQMLYVSPIYEEIWGRSCASLYANPRALVESVHPDDLPRVRAAQRAMTEQDRPFDEEYRIVRPDGAVRWVWNRVFPIRDAQGRHYRYAGVAEDVTARKEAEANLLRQAVIVENISEAIIVSDTDFVIRLWNQGAEALYGWPAAEAIGRTSLELLWPVYAEPRENVVRAFLDAGYWQGEVLHHRRDGTPVYVLCSVNLVRPAGAGSASVISICRDITGRRQSEEALRLSEDRYRTIFENSALGLFESTPGGQVLRVNPAYARMYGFASPQEVLEKMGDVAGTIYVQPERRAEVVRAVLDKPGAQVFEIEYRRLDGRHFIGSLTLQAVRDAAGNILYLFGFVEDITERKRAEAALQALNVKLEGRVAERTAQLDAANQELSAINVELNTANTQLAHALRSRDEFLAAMSHELRTPLTGILGLTEVMQMNVYGPLSEKQEHALQAIRQSGEHLLALITDILDLSKVGAGKLELQIAPVNVTAVCQASLELVKGQAQPKHLKLRLRLDQAPARMEADERRLKQILVNLLGNAVKFTPDGGEVGLDVTGEEAAGVVRFAVWDTGIGIAAEVMPRLFKPFVQLDNRLNRDHAGTGLGLALTHELVQLHGGSITLESAGIPGQGSRFTVALPWQSQAPEPAPGSAGAGEAAFAGAGLPAAPGELILLAEDNLIALTAVRDVLAARGYQVATAANGVEALAQARALNPALILLDIQMPVMDGLEVTRRLRADPDARLSSIPIVAITALTMPGDRERCLAAGVNAYLPKPLVLQELFQVMEICLSARN